MSNLLAGKVILGSSNVYRLCNNGNKTAIKDFKMIKCTRAETFDAHMSNLNEECSMVLISVNGNFHH